MKISYFFQFVHSRQASKGNCCNYKYLKVKSSIIFTFIDFLVNSFRAEANIWLYNK